MTINREVRIGGSIKVERRDDGGADGKIVGYAAVFGTPTDLGWVREQIAPNAFSGALNSDVRALFNHDPNVVLGRTTAGTLKLSQDDHGLRYEITPPDTQAARDLMVSIDRGDVSQSSFAFVPKRVEWDFEQDPPLRTILECDLYDVSPVTYPAYDTTEVGLRTLEAARAERAPKPEPFSPDLLRRSMELGLRERGLLKSA